MRPAILKKRVTIIYDPSVESSYINDIAEYLVTNACISDEQVLSVTLSDAIAKDYTVDKDSVYVVVMNDFTTADTLAYINLYHKDFALGTRFIGDNKIDLETVSTEIGLKPVVIYNTDEEMYADILRFFKPNRIVIGIVSDNEWFMNQLFSELDSNYGDTDEESESTDDTVIKYVVKPKHKTPTYFIPILIEAYIDSFWRKKPRPKIKDLNIDIDDSETTETASTVDSILTYFKTGDSGTMSITYIWINPGADLCLNDLDYDFNVIWVDIASSYFGLKQIKEIRDKYIVNAFSSVKLFGNMASRRVINIMMNLVNWRFISLSNNVNVTDNGGETMIGDFNVIHSAPIKQITSINPNKFLDYSSEEEEDETATVTETPKPAKSMSMPYPSSININNTQIPIKPISEFPGRKNHPTTHTKKK